MSHHDEPNWEDVRWDHRVSDEAAGALRRAAAVIEQALDEEGHYARDAAGEWRGASQAEFERRRGRLVDELRVLAAACRGAAERVRRAAVWAAEEQHRRERAREEWEREEERRRSAHG